MSWQLSSQVDLRNDRVTDNDADRQTRTAEEIIRRMDDQPGVVLADEVGMGKTYVALAVAASVLEATNRQRPVIVMVPPAIAEKWRTEWAVFADRCLKPGHGLRAAGPVGLGIDLLKLLDDPAATRPHVIFLTHGALTRRLTDPFVRLALLRQATLRRQERARQQRSIARFAESLLNDRLFADERLVQALLDTPPAKWMKEWNRWRPHQALADEPVPMDLLEALRRIDLSALRDALAEIPANRGRTFQDRLRRARRQLNATISSTWTASLSALDVRLPLLVLDEAHHVKNPNRLARLFANEEAERDAEALQGPLGNMFARMLFLTATPFQLGHHELLAVLDRFNGVRWPSAAARAQFDDQMTELRQALDRAQATALRLERAWSRIDPLQGPDITALTSFEPRDDQPEPLRTALAIASEARTELQACEMLLRPWVIRHLKPHKAERRRYLPGRGILDEKPTDIGLPVGGSATLPFLLAARAQALASLHGPDGKHSTQAYFAYGLASSFEAYADTRRNRIATLDDLGEVERQPIELPKQLRWYLDRIAKALPDDTAEGWAGHPKVAGTVGRVLDLWRHGEKALVFCFYVETGRALRSHISRALRSEIVMRAADALDELFQGQ